MKKNGKFPPTAHVKAVAYRGAGRASNCCGEEGRCFECLSRGGCVTESMVCDGEYDCKDGSDEDEEECGGVAAGDRSRRRRRRRREIEEGKFGGKRPRSGSRIQNAHFLSFMWGRPIPPAGKVPSPPCQPRGVPTSLNPCQTLIT